MWNYNRIKKSLNTNSYYAFNKYLSKSELKNSKYIVENFKLYKTQFSKNLQKKYYEIKKYNNKLKGNWYEFVNIILIYYKLFTKKR